MAVTILKQANELPSPTWNHLEINGIDLEVPAVEGFDAGAYAAPAKPVKRDVPAYDAENAFDAPEAAPALAGPWACAGSELPASLIAGGMGAAASAWIEAAAGERVVLEVADYGRTDVPFVVDLAEKGPVVVVDVRVGRGASASVALVAGEGSPGGLVPADGAVPQTKGWLLLVDAGQDARVEVLEFVAPGEGSQMLDDAGIRAAAGARVEVRQFYLGSDVLAAGFACDLAGERSELSLDARFVGRGSEVLDFGYAVRNRGARTVSDMAMHGVLADEATKSLRTTIDLMNGAKGASGVENESVVLAGEGVSNKSLPVILCDEDDVAGTHGASVGEVDPGRLAYLATRGIDAEEARGLLMEATYAAALDAAGIAPQAHRAVLAATVRALGAQVASELDLGAGTGVSA